jgi:hypothetical protein
MRLLYRLFALLTGVIASRLGRSVFKDLWSRIDDGEPPAPTNLDASLRKVVLAATLEAATMAGVGAVSERITASAFHHLFGVSVAPKDKQD